MNCAEVAQNDIAERYVAGQLTDAEQDAFEAHFFECRACTEEVRTLQAIQTGLESRPAVQSSHVWRWAAAAILVLAGGLAWWGIRPRAPVEEARRPVEVPAVKPEPERFAQLDLLARVEPPPYREPAFRGADEAEAKFRAAMKRYQQHDYAGAIPGLVEASRLNPKAPGIRFFLGVSYLLNGQPAEGAETLRALIAIGDSLELGDAHFYLAQGLLGQHDLSGATAELNQAITAKSERSGEAQRLLAEIAKLNGTPK
jgi:hypothetical protein